MSTFEYYLWIAFFVTGIVALPFMFRHRKVILCRIRIAYNQAKSNTFHNQRRCYIEQEKIDPWKENNFR